MKETKTKKKSNKRLRTKQLKAMRSIYRVKVTRKQFGIRLCLRTDK